MTYTYVLAEAREGAEMEKKIGSTWFEICVSVGLIIGVIISIVLVLWLFFVRPANAERQLSLKDGTLTVWADVMKVVGVPKEITDTEIAFQLATGQKKEATVRSEEKEVYTLAFPFFKKKTVYRESIATYRNGEWVMTPAVDKSTEPIIDLFFTGWGLWMPVVAILIAIVVVPNVFPAWTLATASVLLTTLTFASIGNFPVVLHYLLFLLIVGVGSFGIVWIMRLEKKRQQTLAKLRR